MSQSAEHCIFCPGSKPSTNLSTELEAVVAVAAKADLVAARTHAGVSPVPVPSLFLEESAPCL